MDQQKVEWYEETTSPQPKPLYVLNEGQQQALDTIVQWILSPAGAPRWCVLEGYAGVGKTFTLNRIVEKVRQINPHINFGMTAPTHKAVRQIRKFSELKDRIDFGTIHSFLGLKQVEKDHPREKGKRIVVYELDFEANKERKIDKIQVLIVDETSMLDFKLFGHIQDYLRWNSSLFVIFTGDPLQIPPVGQKDETGSAEAIPFIPEQRSSLKMEHLVLEEIVRQGKGNPIIEYATAIREGYKSQYIPHDPVDLGETGVSVLFGREMGQKGLVELFTRYFDTPNFEKDTDFVKVIAWRNKTVDYFNSMIRKIIYRQDNLPKIMVDEKLVLSEPLISKDDKILLANNEEIVVHSVEVKEHVMKYKYIEQTNAFDRARNSDNPFDSPGEVTERHKREITLKVYVCQVENMDGRRLQVEILHESSEAAFKELKSSIANQAKKLRHKGQVFEGNDMWTQFYKLGKSFCWVGYNYCLTAHKAQGSTFDYCISMEWDINQNWDIEERNRIKYVAATRARNKLFIIRE